MRRPRRILVVRTDRVGDVVLATPLLRALRATFPEAYLGALVRPYTRDVLLHNPHLDLVITDDPAGADAGWRGFWRQVARLRRERFETALLLMPTSRAAWLLFFAGIRHRIGVGRKFYEVVTGMRTVSRRGYVPLRHEADYCLDLGRAIGVRTGDLDRALEAEVFPTTSELATARREWRGLGIDDGRRAIVVHPTGGGSAPNWSIDRWMELGRVLVERDEECTVIVTGESTAPHLPQHPRIVDRRGRRGLRALIADLAQADVVVAPSTGPLHLAAAAGVPTVALFCPLPACSPQLWGPRGRDGAASTIVLPPADCCPGRCPRDPKSCRFEEIAVGAVADAVLRALESSRGK